MSIGSAPRPRRARALVCVCAVALFGAAGCFRTTIVDSPVAPRGVTHREWSSTFLFGLVGDPEVDVRRHCPAGATRVRAGGNLLATGIAVLTVGIYVPRVVALTCAEPPVAHPVATAGGRGGAR